jgi:hypothetical protein
MPPLIYYDQCMGFCHVQSFDIPNDPAEKSIAASFMLLNFSSGSIFQVTQDSETGTHLTKQNKNKLKLQATEKYWKDLW